MKEEILSIVTHALMGVEVSGETVDLIVNQVMKAIYDERPVLKNIEELENKLRVTKKALEDIVKWNDELENEWGEPDNRANAALQKIMVMDGF